ncbi:hypothetical protein BO94DRAFT_377655 [Aspergillus sclerotioniger CBS 115572]|uniref:Uncharacterized protein n=1 Tax=Aspergillus sclerotioniger CBS 115572 TaxID=1450535 RepID=A0A317X274_9EURO|nr:hypothetical protein BO94DRAFT_377655 [Aspergillus sclerotioniger CBS 115572]PWY91702.1 hypothetical protein BO94DRAFT_377655 [Aspergillus sclerotioniger CBS 115572]
MMAHVNVPIVPIALKLSNLHCCGTSDRNLFLSGYIYFARWPLWRGITVPADVKVFLDRKTTESFTDLLYSIDNRPAHRPINRRVASTKNVTNKNKLRGIRPTNPVARNNRHNPRSSSQEDPTVHSIVFPRSLGGRY